jgi:hypothetical protein
MVTSRVAERQSLRRPFPIEQNENLDLIKGGLELKSRRS